MKKFLQLLLLFPLSLTAQSDSTRTLDLGNIIIEGETEMFRVETVDPTGLDSLWQIKDSKLYEYEPETASVTVAPLQGEWLGRQGAVSLTAGWEKYGNLQAVFSSLSSRWLNLRLGMHYKFFQEDWDTRRAFLNWLPETGKFIWDIALDYGQNNSPTDSVEVVGGGLTLAVREMLSLGQGVQLGGSLYMAYHDFQGESEQASDMDFRSHLKLQYREFMLENRFGLLKQTVSGELTIVSRGFPYSDKLGVWLGADTLHVYPSLIFNGSYQILPGFSLLLENDPRISAWSRYDHLSSQPFQSLLGSRLQTKIPLNATAMLIYESDFRLALSYSYSSYRDYLSYADIAGIYALQPVDFEQQKFSLQAGYYREAGSISLEGKYYLPDEDIPFLPKYQITGGICLNPGKVGIDIQAGYSADAETQLGEKMDPVITLQARCRYQLFQNLDLIVEGFNLLDRENLCLPLLPAEPIRLGAGFIWKF